MDDNEISESEVTEMNIDDNIEIFYPLTHSTEINDNDLTPLQEYEEIRERKPWPMKTRDEVYKYFRYFLNTKRVPGKVDCEKFIRLYKVTDRRLTDVKNLIYNEKKKGDVSRESVLYIVCVMHFSRPSSP